MELRYWLESVDGKENKQQNKVEKVNIIKSVK